PAVLALFDTGRAVAVDAHRVVVPETVDQERGIDRHRLADRGGAGSDRPFHRRAEHPFDQTGVRRRRRDVVRARICEPESAEREHGHRRGGADPGSRPHAALLLGIHHLCSPVSMVTYSVRRRSSCALMATITVESDIRIAPTAGASTIPFPASTPAASGIATML